jgi:hypothetical protein
VPIVALAGKTKEKIKESIAKPLMVSGNSANSSPRLQANQAPKRITITLPFKTFKALEHRSTKEGRSISNLAAYLLERGLTA